MKKRLVEVYFMKNMIRGAGILAAIVAVFMLMTACAPKGMTRTNEGAASHGFDSTPDNSSDDQSYTTNDDFDLESTDAAPPSKARKSSPADDTYADEDEVTVKAVKASSTPRDTAVSGDDNSFFQTGTASWYGREFHGKKTASGEKFDMNDLTAAHRTLPLGSVVMVKNLDNGKMVKVRINDRGPFKGKRILDLSYAAAKRLNMVADGEAMVGIKVLGAAGQDYSSRDVENADEEAAGTVENESPRASASRTLNKSDSAGEGGFAVQTGAFYSRRNADKLKGRLSEIFPESEVGVFRDGDLYKVRMLNVGNRRDAEKIKRTLSDEEIESFVTEE
ncbi:MAG: septal ring lytic transglycosylase RlpA family protein [Spirochaetota bacterium]